MAVIKLARSARKARTLALLRAIHDTSDKQPQLLRKAVADINAQEPTFYSELEEALAYGYTVAEILEGLGETRVSPDISQTRAVAVTIAMINVGSIDAKTIAKITGFHKSTIHGYIRKYKLQGVVKRYESKRHITA